MNWSVFLDQRVTFLLFALIAGHVGQLSYGGYFHNPQMKGQRLWLLMGYLHVAISFLLIGTALVATISLSSLSRLLDERFVLALLGLNLVQHGFFIWGHYHMHPIHKDKVTYCIVGKVLLVAGLAILIACVSHIASMVALVLGLAWAYPDYLRWFHDFETLARSPSKWVLRRPWMWVPVLVEVGIGRLVNRLSEKRRAHLIKEKNAIEIARSEIKAKRKADRLCAALLWCLSVPFAVIIPILYPKPPIPFFVYASVPFILVFASASWTFLQRSWCFKPLLENLDNGQGEKDLQETISAGRKFAIYLRDFAGESGPRESHSFSAMDQAQTTFPATRRRERLERALLGEIAERLQVYGFTNYFDFVEHPTARRVSTIGDDWQPRFITYASRASLIIVLIEHLGEGMEFELEWLGNNEFRAAVAVVTSQKGFDSLGQSHAAILARARWKIQLSNEEYCESLPQSLLQYVSRIQDNDSYQENES